MDCQMPLMDGFEATRRIRALESAGSHLPIIAMTAHVQEKNSAECIAAGMDDYLAKPLKLSALRSKLAQWIDATEFSSVAETESNHPATGSDTAKMNEPLDQGILGELRDSLGDTVGQVIEFYLEDTPGLLDELEKALQQEDGETLAQRAHNIKGSSRNVGAHRLANLCKAMEDCGRSGITEGTEQLLRRLSAEFERVRAALQHEIKDPSDRDDSVDRVDARILVVDDDRGMRVALRNILEQTGYRIQEAANGEMALALCERKIPDLVLMDAMMPVVDGFEACTKIRQLPGAAQLPILIVTALDDEKSIERAFAAGATDYIPKPVHFSVLRRRVGRLLEAGRAERHVHHLAYHDALTGLPNRAFVTERLGELLAKNRPDREMVAVLFLDLDRFKLVNDTLGHDVGDLLLQAVSERIKGGMRSGDLVARLGGDEFVVVLDGVRSADVAAGVAEKIWHVLSEPFVFMGQEMYVTTSIGIALHPQDGDDISTLMKRADTAMFRAKESRGHFQFYEQNMEVEISNRLALESELRRAIERQELILHYQPQTRLESGELVGMEALVRWQHPERGLLPPSEFIGLAEETGLIDKLGEWVMREACSQVTRWRRQGLGAIRVAVNLSSRQLGQDDLPEIVAGVLSETGVPPQCLELEITESSIMNRADGGVSVLQGLRDIGVTLAIDDFGTGYSSLSSLKRFPVDMLKIDRSFVRDSVTNSDDAAIITGIVALAQSMRLKVMAEGVETGDQQTFLRELGCDFMQGFFLSEPVCANTFEARFLKDRWKAAESSSEVIRLDDHRGIKH
jgi:diguanylate cyclase (GGDEF)-like protein